MGFKYCSTLLFTNQPSLTAFRETYGMENYFTTSGGFSQVSPTFIVNTSYINTRTDYAIDAGYDGIIWDDEDGVIYEGYDNRKSNDATIDATLNALQQVCETSKQRAIARGRPDFKVGLYSHPGFPDDYNTPVLYKNAPTNPTYLAAYNAWRDAYARTGKRYSGTPGVYIDVPFTSFCDLICPSIYTPYGRRGGPTGSTSLIDDWVQVSQLVVSAVRQVADTIYPYHTFAYSPAAQWANQSVDAYTVNSILNVLPQIAEGVILWGFGPSFVWRDFTFRPAGYTNGTQESTILSSWTGITNGAMALDISRTQFLVSGVNTFGVTGATGMTTVCQRLTERINAAVAATAYILTPYNQTYEVPLGPITVSWDSTYKSFYFNLANPTGSTFSSQPPNMHRGNYASPFIPINVTGISGGTASVPFYTGTTAYKEISSLIGSSTTNQTGRAPLGNSFVYGYADRQGNLSSTRSQFEWDDYAVGQPWWNAFSEKALAQKQQDAINAVVPPAGSSQYIVVNGRVYRKDEYERLTENF